MFFFLKYIYIYIYIIYLFIYIYYTPRREQRCLSRIMAEMPIWNCWILLRYISQRQATLLSPCWVTGDHLQNSTIPIIRMVLSRTQRWQWDIFHLLFPWKAPLVGEFHLPRLNTFDYRLVPGCIMMHLASTCASVGYLRFCSQNLIAGAGQINRFSLLNTNADGSQQSGWCLAN